MNSQTLDQDCLSDSDSYSYSHSHETDQTQTQTKKQTHIQTILNKRYEELRTQILELGSLESQSPSSPSPSSATQWWERESGQIGEEFNLITQQGMVSWMQVWLELKPIIRDTDADADTDTDIDIELIENPAKMSRMQREKRIQLQLQPGQETIKKSNGNGGGTRDRGHVILDYPGALVGVLSDMVLNAIEINVAQLNNKYNTLIH